MTIEIIELVPGIEVGRLETAEVVREVLTTAAEQGPPGPPGTAAFDLNLSLIYQSAKL
nr:hypothetical protein [uncultured Pseudogulbenkiania sp.]